MKPKDPAPEAPARETRVLPKLRTYTVIPRLPEPLKRLEDLAFNLWWTWEPDARELFLRLDRKLWRTCGQNPVALLAELSQKRLDACASDESYLAHLRRIAGKFDYYLSTRSWFTDKRGALENPIAYFSMEFGLDSSIPIYSGGLGVLAGDHLKAASDLGVPLVGVGLLYRQGYFRQYLNSDGWQQEFYPENAPDQIPVRIARTPDGQPVRVSVDLGGRSATCQVWRVDVGGVPLFLLDTYIPENHADDRVVTAKLYSGANDMRIRQEIVLGVAGLRALETLGFSPSVCHMNEGHSAFLGIEWIRRIMAEGGVDFDAARQAVSAGSLFTTHTPVPAGNDEFTADLVRQHFAPVVESLGISMETFLALGQAPGAAADSPFHMTLLAMRLARGRNGVSELHGSVSRKMWRHVWPEAPLDEVPIGSVTNGVHLRTWLSGEFDELLSRYVGPKWIEQSDDPEVWERVENVPDSELWRAHERRRERLVATARRRLQHQLRQRSAPAPEVEAAGEALDPRALTIGFARRFATYKRATLLFADLDRLARILSNRERPVQLLFAGKAHPRDDAGKDFIRSIIHVAREERFRQHIVFLEDYEMNLARDLVQGVDVWLNTPRRPYEASGTSGMKAAANGVLNLSVLDGWWVEGFSPELGWAIGSGEVYEDTGYQDQVEVQALYDVLEHEIVPAFYDRGNSGVPRQWTRRMKACMAKLAPRFTMHRMMKEYVDHYYVGASRRFSDLSRDGFTRAKQLSTWMHEVELTWGTLAVESVEADTDTELPVGADLPVRAKIQLGKLHAEDVQVELFHGKVAIEGHIDSGRAVPMTYAGEAGEGLALFEGTIPCDKTGHHAFAVRVLPHHADLPGRHEMNLIRWS